MRLVAVAYLIMITNATEPHHSIWCTAPHQSGTTSVERESTAWFN